ncbi:Pimeloyl-ACP methyl ester carboxylesterase [Nonomuraea maritima]|uniref:Pimeloyl-ACP methyl ester carboxylesterase n=1 Tax=Nonomuraea maritima TaxID=683260 RepID=A0A1G9ARY7_9ACTN|nr:alpha/beta hydrolase [Nonomuraea maritima]SDK30037.1 Pimeloyl-ACP methyl ester carboxylesterase [Nonomuraea maritima]
MATFALIHGGGGAAWQWHLVEPELRRRGHDVVAVDLPFDDEDAGLLDYADTVVEALGGRRDVVVVGHSWGGFVAPLVCARTETELLVLVTAMIPAPGEPPSAWWTNTGFKSAELDEIELFLHDVPAELAADLTARSRGQADKAVVEPWPLDAWPDVPTRFLLCRDDRFFTPEFMRRVVRERLGITPDEIGGSHMPMLARPAELAQALDGYLTGRS